MFSLFCPFLPSPLQWFGVEVVSGLTIRPLCLTFLCPRQRPKNLGSGPHLSPPYPSRVEPPHTTPTLSHPSRGRPDLTPPSVRSGGGGPSSQRTGDLVYDLFCWRLQGGDRGLTGFLPAQDHKGDVPRPCYQNLLGEGAEQ